MQIYTAIKNTHRGHFLLKNYVFSIRLHWNSFALFRSWLCRGTKGGKKNLNKLFPLLSVKHSKAVCDGKSTKTDWVRILRQEFGGCTSAQLISLHITHQLDKSKKKSRCVLHHHTYTVHNKNSLTLGHSRVAWRFSPQRYTFRTVSV